MSNLAKLLKSRQLGANSANPANPGQCVGTSAAPISNFSKISAPPNSIHESAAALPHGLGARMLAMAARWKYSETEIVHELSLAATDPDWYLIVVADDEYREAEWRAKGLMPRADA